MILDPQFSVYNSSQFTGFLLDASLPDETQMESLQNPHTSCYLSCVPAPNAFVPPMLPVSIGDHSGNLTNRSQLDFTGISSRATSLLQRLVRAQSHQSPAFQHGFRKLVDTTILPLFNLWIFCRFTNVFTFIKETVEL